MRANKIQNASQRDRSISPDNDKSLGELSADYHALIRAGRPLEPAMNPLAGFSWTGVVNMAHFSVTGCRDNPLSEDVAEAWAEISAAHEDGVPPWDFVFNAKEHELPDSAADIEQYRLPVEALEELGKKATRLRDQADERASLINYQGYADDAPRQPLERSQRELKEQSKLRMVKHLAKEEAHIERYESQLSSKYRKRRYCELTAAEITAI